MSQPDLISTLARDCPEGDRAPGADAYDECFDAAGQIRPHWQTLLATFDKLGEDEISLRADSSRRLLAEHGVGCFSDRTREGAEQPWQLDLIPFIVSAAEWRDLEAGLLQRAHLLNLILADLHGMQHLVRDGLLPAPLVFANPGYLRPCQSVKVPDDIYLKAYAADLVRSPEGRWWVLADRTQAPAGLGFALENRSVLSRVLPEAMDAVRPRPLSDTLWRLAGHHSGHSGMVLLTPGPRNEAYFEHAYLARHLGVTLVEGDDLTVRDQKLFLKTLDGLRQVEAVFRRVTDVFCDPLELRGDSLLGVPGLVEAARAGNVVLHNALGAGLLESPGFAPFLPGLCRHLLGEELRLPSVATWWCGQAAEEAYVQKHLAELALRPAFSLDRIPPAPPGGKVGEAEWLRQQIQLNPHQFVGQERVALSRAPFGARLREESRRVVLRGFVLHDRRDFSVVPGGLARVCDSAAGNPWDCPLNVPNKDLWILPDTSEGAAAAQVISPPKVALERAPSDLPSRVADNFFWLGRYTERLEQVLRVCAHVLRCLDEDAGAMTPARLEAFKRMLARLALASESAPLQKEVLLLLFQDGRSGGVRDLLRRLQFAAFTVRDRLSGDTWRILNRLGPDARQRPGKLPLVEAARTVHTLILDLAAFSGMEMENMTRGHGWVFLDFGRRVERSVFMARLLEVVLSSEADLGLLLEPALGIADSVMTHRRRYFSEARAESVLEVLATDRANPRSLGFQITTLANHAAGLPPAANPEGTAAVRAKVAALSEILARMETGAALDTLRAADQLRSLTLGLGELSDLLSQVFFSHIVPRVN